jgi:hypothetical protein
MDAKCFGERQYVTAVQKVPLISPGTATDRGAGFESYNERGKLNKGGYLMKTTKKSKCRIPVLLSILCAGLVATFLGGCADSPYVTAYDGGYYPAGYYTGYSYDYNAYPYTYYGPASDTVVRSGVRYSDAYGPRYSRTRTVYGDW